jgi:hypothetical protein
MMIDDAAGVDPDGRGGGGGHEVAWTGAGGVGRISGARGWGSAECGWCGDAEGACAGQGIASGVCREYEAAGQSAVYRQALAEQFDMVVAENAM